MSRGHFSGYFLTDLGIEIPPVLDALETPTNAAVQAAKSREKAYKLADGQGMYLHVAPSGAKHWRLKYRVDGKERVHAIGVYPTVSLLAAWKARDATKDQIRAGLDPSHEKRRVKLETSVRRTNSFEAIARVWHGAKYQTWKPSYADGVIALIEKELFPALGARPIAQITAPELLGVLRKIEARGAFEMSKKSMQLAGQVFRFGVVTGRCERDPTPDL